MSSSIALVTVNLMAAGRSSVKLSAGIFITSKCLAFATRDPSFTRPCSDVVTSVSLSQHEYIDSLDQNYLSIFGLSVQLVFYIYIVCLLSQLCFFFSSHNISCTL